MRGWVSRLFHHWEPWFQLTIKTTRCLLAASLEVKGKPRGVKITISTPISVASSRPFTTWPIFSLKYTRPTCRHTPDSLTSPVNTWYLYHLSTHTWLTYFTCQHMTPIRHMGEILRKTYHLILWKSWCLFAHSKTHVHYLQTLKITVLVCSL